MSGSIWVVALALPCLTATAVTAVRSEAVLLRHRAEGVADRAALAGADELALRGPPLACPGAAWISRADGAALSTCAVEGDRVLITVRITGVLPVAGTVAVTAASAAEPGGSGQLPLPLTPP